MPCAWVIWSQARLVQRATFSSAMSVDLSLRIVRRQALRPCAEFANEARAGRRLVEGVRIDEFVEQQGKIRDLSREEPADRANIDEALQRRRLFLQQGEVGR